MVEHPVGHAFAQAFNLKRRLLRFVVILMHPGIYLALAQITTAFVGRLGLGLIVADPAIVL